VFSKLRLSKFALVRQADWQGTASYMLKTFNRISVIEPVIEDAEEQAEEQVDALIVPRVPQSRRSTSRRSHSCSREWLRWDVDSAGWQRLRRSFSRSSFFFFSRVARFPLVVGSFAVFVSRL
jgi:hypothetical protein